MTERRETASDTGPLITLEKLSSGYRFIRLLYDNIIIPGPCSGLSFWTQASAASFNLSLWAMLSGEVESLDRRSKMDDCIDRIQESA